MHHISEIVHCIDAMCETSPSYYILCYVVHTMRITMKKVCVYTNGLCFGIFSSMHSWTTVQTVYCNIMFMLREVQRGIQEGCIVSRDEGFFCSQEVVCTLRKLLELAKHGLETALIRSPCNWSS